MYKTLTPQGDNEEEKFLREEREMFGMISSADVGTRPVPELSGRENVWYNNAFDLSTANFTRESSSSKSVSFENFCAKVSQNVCYFTLVNNEKKCRRGRMLALGGHIYVTNNHNICDVSSSGMINMIFTHAKGVNSNAEFVISESDVHRIPERDLCFLTLRCLPPKKKIYQYIQKGDSNGVFNGSYINRSSEGKITINTVKKIRLLPERKIVDKTFNINSKHNLWSGQSEISTSVGDCGMPLVINSSYGYSIVGLHFLANEKVKGEVYATSLDGEFITQVYDSLKMHNVGEGDLSMI